MKQLFEGKNSRTRFQRGFTLVELLVVIVILAALSFLLILLINPVEQTKKSRDAIRLSDISSVSRAVGIAIDVAGEPNAALLCVNTPSPCTGLSNSGVTDPGKSDGSGWVKVKLDSVAGANFPKLPIDPMNIGNYHYRYYSNGSDFEVGVVFESEAFRSKMEEDGGNNAQIYELGTNLKLVN